MTIALPPPVPRNRPRVSQEPFRMHMSQEGSCSHAVNPHGPVMHDPRGTVSWAEPPRSGPIGSRMGITGTHNIETNATREGSRRVRPSQFQEWVQKYDGSHDPYDHSTSFKQVLRAEQVTDFHTQYEGFGLTLEGKALSWFQTLEPAQYVSFEQVEEGFVMSLSKMGIKHNTDAQIYNFKQKPHETVRDCANRMREYVVRCHERNPKRGTIGVIVP